MDKKEKDRLALKDYALKFGDGSRFLFKKGEPVVFTAPKGLDKSVILKQLENEGVIDGITTRT